MVASSASSTIRLIDTYLQTALHEGLPPLKDDKFSTIFVNPLDARQDDAVIQSLVDYDRRIVENQFSQSFHEELIVDLDWRFSNKTIKDHIAALSNSKKILFIGVPTVFFFMKKLGWEKLILVDRNPLYRSPIDDRGVITADIRDWRTLPLDRDFDAVVIDPPWYLNDITYWTWVAFNFVKSTGTVIANVYPPTIRPGAGDELATYFRSASNLFQKSSFKISMYNSPSFEREVFSKRGTPYLENWRRGISLVFGEKKEANEVDASGLVGGLIDRGDSWRRSIAQDGVVEAQLCSPRSTNSALSYEFFDSVSTRHPDWRNIVSVNSRNLVGVAR